tara:strand:- start:7066 stop:7251 length:186 start_codon:yes stop_codon:yes gene_type:complete
MVGVEDSNPKGVNTPPVTFSVFLEKLDTFADKCQRLCRDNLFVLEVSEGYFAAMRKVVFLY